LIVADGFSCREQIEQGTERRAHHLAEALEMAMKTEAMKPELEQVVVITGASAGVGRAAARAFACRGAAIGLIARGRAGLEAAKKDVEARGGSAIVIECDVSRPEDVEAAAARVEAELGPIDVWVNNAMVSVYGPFSEMTTDELKRITDVTYLG